jgi:dienelactone hydrolase
VLAAVPWLAADPMNNGKVGVVGFCYGGGLALRAASETVGVDCAVSFYGRPLPTEQARKLKVPVLLHYAGNDERINSGIPDFKAALDEAHVRTPSTCTRVPSMASTTIRARRATTRPLLNSRGNARSISSRCI